MPLAVTLVATHPESLADLTAQEAMPTQTGRSGATQASESDELVLLPARSPNVFFRYSSSGLISKVAKHSGRP